MSVSTAMSYTPPRDAVASTIIPTIAELLEEHRRARADQIEALLLIAANVSHHDVPHICLCNQDCANEACE